LEVYSAGNIGYKAVYWKNNVPVYLTNGSTPSMVNSIFVKGTDVYAVGYESLTTYRPFDQTAPIRIAKLWKNGVATTLSNTVLGGEATSVVVSGTDVYITGIEVGAAHVTTIGYSLSARLWKNNVSVPLNSINTADTFATSVFVVGTDVYVAGYGIAYREMYKARYWKNGVETILPGAADNKASSIFVYGNLVYVAGSQFASSNGNYGVAKYWRNGVENPLTSVSTSVSEATGIFVLDKIVYVSGKDKNIVSGSGVSNTLNSKAVIWKNGAKIALSDDSSDSSANAIMVLPLAPLLPILPIQ
jgi:hypothetical protein